MGCVVSNQAHQLTAAVGILHRDCSCKPPCRLRRMSDPVFIVKPCASSRGRGIKLITNKSQIPSTKKNLVRRTAPFLWRKNGSRCPAVVLFTACPVVLPLPVLLCEGRCPFSVVLSLPFLWRFHCLSLVLPLPFLLCFHRLLLPCFSKVAPLPCGPCSTGPALH